MYRFDREKMQKPTETSEPQSKCTDMSERGNLGVMLLVRVNPRHIYWYISIGGVVCMWPFLIPPPLGQPHSIFGVQIACWLFFCNFHNPLNSDMNYRIFNMCTRCVYTRGLGTLTVSQHNFFNSKQVFLVLLTVFEPSLWVYPVPRCNHWANPSPQALSLKQDKKKYNFTYNLY